LYLKHFGFREPPFNLTPDPRFFYDSAFHREAWASLVYGINEKKGFVVVTGEVGTGKTTLIRKLLHSLEATHRSVFIFNTLLSFDELLEAIVRDLDLDPASGRVAMFQQLNEFLLDQAMKGHIVSLVFDEAQNLNDDALEAVRLLSNMETDREKLLQIILVGQPELDVKLNSRALRQLKQRVSLWCRLDRLNQTDTETYIAHRLSVAGYQGPEIFSRASLQVIWEHTAGVPRLINAVCDNVLVTAFAMSKKMVTPEMVHEVARDLRLAANSQDFDRLQVECREPAQPAMKYPTNVAEIADNKGANRSGRGDEQERRRFARGTVEVVRNLGLKREPVRSDLPESAAVELKRLQPRPVASVAELKELKNHPGETQEIPTLPSEAWIGRRASAASKSDSRQNTVVSAAFFNELIAALTDAMGPIAPLVVREQIAALGEALERFPMIKLSALLGAIKPEILNDYLRAVFEQRVMKQIQEYSQRFQRRGM
jgi:type II secretory pathway predicted ATPase ExeA